MEVGTKGKPTQFRTCNKCRNIPAEHQSKKRELRTDIDNDQENSDVLEIIDLSDLRDHIMHLLNPGKEVPEELVELVEDVDEFAWIKHEDSSKHRDTPSMERFNCDGILKIAIEREANKVKLTLKHKLIHAQTNDVTIPQSIKEFIEKYIDLLPREIYARLIDNNMNY
ncbi:32217_t:CDS:2 [Gigaspora margarita]|uniref:32217_t:CDS:1 n=1 Tax=Gigaspora margarita TaxID=4874 RepID=A0ABN7VWF8_GIGMA|nr:32217_t:CDS:2 [Gigaspora margarita]